MMWFCIYYNMTLSGLRIILLICKNDIDRSDHNESMIYHSLALLLIYRLVMLLKDTIKLSAKSSLYVYFLTSDMIYTIILSRPQEDLLFDLHQLGPRPSEDAGIPL